MDEINDIIIDTNALVLYILGSINPNYIGEHKRLSIYELEDFDWLSYTISRAKRIITCPNIWTEVDNLCNKLVGEDKYFYYQFIQEIQKNSDEKYKETKLICKQNYKEGYFYEIGLTDSIILELAKKCDLLITNDSDLEKQAKANDIKVYNVKTLAMSLRLLEE